MRKKLSLILAAVMLLLVAQITIFAEETTQNLLSDEGFESGVLSDSNSWKFTGGTNWYGYGDAAAGNLGIENEITRSGEYPVSNMLDDGQGFPVDFTIQTSVDWEI